MFAQALSNPVIAIAFVVLVVVVIGGIANAVNTARRAALTKATTTPLMQAAIDGDVEQVTQLLAEGGDVNVATALGDTPLMFAARHSRSEVARLLIDEGADIDAQSDEEKTALILAIEGGDTETARLLIEKGAELDIVYRDPESHLVHWTALTRAIREGDTETAKLLIEKGASLDIPETLTPLDQAVFWGNLAVAQLLLAHGVVPSDSDLQSAAEHRDTEMARLMIEGGANVNGYAHEGNSALHRAAKSGNAEMVRLLIDNGANVNKKDASGIRPLNKAKRGDTAVRELLQQAGAK